MGKEGYLNTNAHLEAKVALLMAQLAESQARELGMREAMRLFIKEAESYGEAWARCYVANFDRVAADSKEQRFRLLAVARDRLKSVGESMVEPIDGDSALREMIEAAKAEEREMCAQEAERQSQDEPYGHAKFRCANIAAEIRARNPEKPSGLSERVMTVFAQMQAVSHERVRKG